MAYLGGHKILALFSVGYLISGHVLLHPSPDGELFQHNFGYMLKMGNQFHVYLFGDQTFEVYPGLKQFLCSVKALLLNCFF